MGRGRPRRPGSPSFLAVKAVTPLGTDSRSGMFAVHPFKIEKNGAIHNADGPPAASSGDRRRPRARSGVRTSRLEPNRQAARTGSIPISHTRISGEDRNHGPHRPSPSSTSRSTPWTPSCRPRRAIRPRAITTITRPSSRPATRPSPASSCCSTRATTTARTTARSSSGCGAPGGARRAGRQPAYQLASRRPPGPPRRRRLNPGMSASRDRCRDSTRAQVGRTPERFPGGVRWVATFTRVGVVARSRRSGGRASGA